MSRNPPAEFRLRFVWSAGECFKCEQLDDVAELGTLTVGGVPVPIAACHVCAWRLERHHHSIRKTRLRVQMARAWQRAGRAHREPVAAP